MSGRIGALAIRPSNGQKSSAGPRAASGRTTRRPARGPAADRQPGHALDRRARHRAVDDTIVYAGTGEGDAVRRQLLRPWLPEVDRRRQHWAPFGRLLPRRLDHQDRRRPDEREPPLRGGHPRPRRRAAADAADHSKFGIWESTDGGVNWKLLKEAKDELNGATDLGWTRRTPNDPVRLVLGRRDLQVDRRRQEVDAVHGRHPAGRRRRPRRHRRASRSAISHPRRRVRRVSTPASTGRRRRQPAVAGLEVRRTAATLADASGGPAGEPGQRRGYCGGQCFYDNVIEVDPDEPEHRLRRRAVQLRHRLGRRLPLGRRRPDVEEPRLGPASRTSTPSPSTRRTPTQVAGRQRRRRLVQPDNRGGRPNAADPLSAVDWENLNGTVDPTHGRRSTRRTNLRSRSSRRIANNPDPSAGPGFWGGTQDNGTLRKSAASATWFDVASGDGGQVLVDPTPTRARSHHCTSTATTSGSRRTGYTDGGAHFFTNPFITSGIDLSDRSEFYVPFVMNQSNTNQLFLGTYRLYRTDNAKAPNAADVHWNAISGDLTTGLHRHRAERRARLLHLARSASAAARRLRRDARGLDRSSARTRRINDTRPGSGSTRATCRTARSPQIAVDRSNYRIAYAAFNGFNAATPRPAGPRLRDDRRREELDGHQRQPAGHSGELAPARPVLPEHALRRHRRRPVRDLQRRRDWEPLGTGFPIVPIWQLDLDPAAPRLAAGTHGRGACPKHRPGAPSRRSSSRRSTPACRSAPASNIDYTHHPQEHRQRRLRPA